MTVQALQHLYSSVERGYFPRHGQGFQTVAVDEGLAGTEDLAVLEEASFYTVSRERRARGDLPLKETFFRLPSGRFALGRTVAWGADALGREGNSLTHHLIVSRGDLLRVGVDPFTLLDATPPLAPAAEGPLPIDLTPRALRPLSLTVAAAEGDLSLLAGLAPPARAALGAALIERGDRSLLLVGDEMRSRALLRAFFSLLPTDERLRLTFSTHFYESDHLRAHFAVVTVGSPSEVPSRSDEYLAFNAEGEPSSQPSLTTAYAIWLASCLNTGEWSKIRAMSAALDRLRGGECPPGEPPLPGGESAGAALWEQVGTTLARALVGQSERIVEYLAQVPDRRRLADALLAGVSPSQLCGAAPLGTPGRSNTFTVTSPDQQETCLRAVRAAASPRAWQSWARQWATDPALTRLAAVPRPWWRRWRR